jgi:hypothetical protein
MSRRAIADATAPRAQAVGGAGGGSPPGGWTPLPFRVDQ